MQEANGILNKTKETSGRHRRPKRSSGARKPQGYAEARVTPEGSSVTQISRDLEEPGDSRDPQVPRASSYLQDPGEPRIFRSWETPAILSSQETPGILRVSRLQPYRILCSLESPVIFMRQRTLETPWIFWSLLDSEQTWGLPAPEDHWELQAEDDSCRAEVYWPSGFLESGVSLGYL